MEESGPTVEIASVAQKASIVSLEKFLAESRSKLSPEKLIEDQITMSFEPGSTNLKNVQLHSSLRAEVAVDQLPLVLDKILKCGNLKVTAIRLSSSELENQRLQIEQAALANARSKAENLAKAANKALGSILKVMYQTTDSNSADQMVTPVSKSPGDSTFSADLGRGSIHESGTAVVYFELIQDAPKLSGATDGVTVSKPRRR